MRRTTVEELWPARARRRVFPQPTGTRARCRSSEAAVDASRTPGASNAGDRAVAIATVLAVLLAGLFSGAPEPVLPPSAVQTAQR
jgi:hypothetical protein